VRWWPRHCPPPKRTSRSIVPATNLTCPSPGGGPIARKMMEFRGGSPTSRGAVCRHVAFPQMEGRSPDRPSFEQLAIAAWDPRGRGTCRAILSNPTRLGSPRSIGFGLSVLGHVSRFRRAVGPWRSLTARSGSSQTQKASGKIRRLLGESQRPLRGRLPSGVSAPPSARPPW